MREYSSQDYHYMTRAIALAKRGLYTTSPNPRVGCVIVNNGEVVGEGYHRKAGEGHAEVNALAQAKALAKGATVYVTLEPCSHYGRTPPCAKALIDAQVSKVICAMVDPNPTVAGNGIAMLKTAGIACSAGLLGDEAKALNPGFITLMEQKRPYVRCKLAASLDGKTAMASGESQWITSENSRQDVQRLRAQSCAIITGADSVITDNARMSVRKEQLADNDYPLPEIRQPIRIVIDSQQRLTPDLAIFSDKAPVLVFTKGPVNKVQWPDFVEHIECPTVESQSGHKIDLAFVLDTLAARGLNDILIEAGATLCGAFIERHLVDELVLYQAPMLLGNEAKSLVNMPSVTTLAQASKLTFKDVRQVGNDLRLTLSIEK
ncbi:bifunctional diaminohydroxyphosphoribosylaminopyrimidine deaminase/5-amino-6-(5-phosphoribosylamino)uracil reductase RibD [Thalassotalea agarivorans]|uniref:Riboflavin biosynthesis protein RibD n=1 Tax=Thalassotalea agarivorans TaxID=349064 RepID=A0A1I0AMW3_THASX|nr:bifunctional diaminohydroxyphosphoribosylaminopyrimidine deaminase/5-amino-6-(5-phosphoribosylamino)uracil reductase RibD [Thalassotalea agarivorans]SES95730.1 diaminohydroxyphosphoribosylaminopyrimidine deaminase [Thalassotalea agarivorans]